MWQFGSKELDMGISCQCALGQLVEQRFWRTMDEDPNDGVSLHQLRKMSVLGLTHMGLE